MAGLQRGAKPPWERKPAGVVTQADIASGAAAAVTDKFPVGADGRVYYETPKGSVVPVALEADPGTALHSNADFESVTASTPDIWDTFWQSGGSFTTETTDVLFGTRSATVATTAGANWQILRSNVFTVAGGDQLTVGVWAHAVTGSPKLQVGILTAASGTPNFFDGVSTGQSSESFALAATFTKYAKMFPIPAGHTAAQLYLRFDPTAAEATSSRVDFTTSARTGASTLMLPGNSWAKEACRAAIFSAVTVAGSAPATVDGVALAVGDRVLYAATGFAGTGIYTVTVVGSGANGTWVRASDASTSAQFAGAQVAITSGTVYGGTRWGTSFKATDTLGTTAMYWDPLGEPPGMVQLFAGATAPTGWLLCDGTSLSRTTYAPLFAAIGVTYGSINGASFTLPDMRGRVAVGFHSGQTEFDTLGETGGAKTHTLTTAEMPAHAHPQNVKQAYTAGGNVAVQGNANAADWTIAANSGGGTAENTGGGGAHNNLQPYIALNYIIKT